MVDIECAICYEKIQGAPIILKCLHSACNLCCPFHYYSGELCPDCRLTSKFLADNTELMKTVLRNCRIRLMEAQIDLINYQSVSLKLRDTIVAELARESSPYSDELIKYMKGALKKCEVAHNNLADVVLAFDHHLAAADQVAAIQDGLFDMRVKFFNNFINSLDKWKAQMDTFKFNEKMW
ncbi:unnamed protein product [Sphagnum jensenii]|uniref:RING-type domain-containing protein n=1 Tax=Sphagnum jensenii TaxID=128206 RepID=A0ABP0VA23_9BRYO